MQWYAHVGLKNGDRGDAICVFAQADGELPVGAANPEPRTGRAAAAQLISRPQPGTLPLKRLEKDPQPCSASAVTLAAGLERWLTKGRCRPLVDRVHWLWQSSKRRLLTATTAAALSGSQVVVSAAEVESRQRSFSWGRCGTELTRKRPKCTRKCQFWQELRQFSAKM